MAIKSDVTVEENRLVARNVRRFRLERALSLGDLARMSGLSKQTLSKVEQGIGNPTIDTLAQLSHALQVPIRRFLTEYGTPVYLQRHADGEWQERPDGDERLLDETFGSGYVRTLFLRLERTRGEPHVVHAHAPGTLHHLYVITGKLRAGPVSDPVDLAAGDFVRFPGDTPHLLSSVADRTTAHMVTTIPQVRQFGPTVRDGAGASNAQRVDAPAP